MAPCTMTVTHFALLAASSSGAPFHRPAHGFGVKRASEVVGVRLSGPLTGEQKLGGGINRTAPWRAASVKQKSGHTAGRHKFEVARLRTRPSGVGGSSSRKRRIGNDHPSHQFRLPN